MKAENIRLDIMGNRPEIGDLIVFQSSKYKTLLIGKCVQFSKSGLPELEMDTTHYVGQKNMSGYYAPKTGFAIYKTKKEMTIVWESSHLLSDDILADAFHILWGTDWKRHWSDYDKAREMRSIFNGGTQPCRPFSDWVKCIEFLSTNLN